eukprot:TRINITY_DN5411_c0_g1_i2.p1 TRINITY_DN5411_c0_g1~~TRINITY_DN5411_c0_g1_i2.p1  ORF type:complete len:381 (-),score=94.66 TRINITY_DN5411_c0_g1_i2:198-1301(-)
MDFISVLAVLFSTVLFLCFAVWWKFLNWPSSTIPGPKPHWLWGSRSEISSIYEVHRDLLRLSGQYGSILRLNMPGRLLIVLSDAAEIRRLFNRPFDELEITPNFQKTFGDVSQGLLILTGDTWRHHRKLLQPAFSPANLKHTVAAANAVCDVLDERWDEHVATGEFFNACSDFSNLTLDVIGLVAFGYEFNTLKTGSSIAAEATNTLSLGVRLRVRLPSWTWWTLRDSKAYSQANKTIHSEVDKVLQARKSGRKNSGPQDAAATRDLMDLMLDTQDTPAGLTDKEILEESVMFFLAGHETTANTLGWLAYCVGRDPEIARKLQAEVDEVLEGRQPTWDDLPKLKYTEMVIKESLRLFPGNRTLICRK